jgi:hypothetical protein
MALLAVKDAAGDTVYLDATGAGTAESPYVVRHGGVVGVSGTPSVVQSGPWAAGLSGVAVNAPPEAHASGTPAAVPTDFQGRLLFASFPPDACVDGTAQLTDAATNATVIAAPADGQRIYVSAIVISNQGADTEVCIKDGTTPRLYVPAPSGGAVLPIPDRLRLSANSALTASGLTPTTSLRVSAVGVKWA